MFGVLNDNFSKLLNKTLRENYHVKFFDYYDNNIQVDVEVLFVRLKHKIDNYILDKIPNLKYICTPTTGLNHINLSEAKDRGIKIISLKGEYEFLKSIKATPEHTLGLAISLLRNYNSLFLSPSRDWSIRDYFIGDELNNNTAGIVGYGRVGKQLNKYLIAFGCKVHCYDVRNLTNLCEGVIKESSISSLIKNTNLIFLCSSYSESNKYMINREHLDQMRGKYFINTARGELVDEAMLIEKIKQGLFKGVALDVIEHECGENRLSEFYQYLQKYNFILTPHIAGSTNQSIEKTDLFILKKLEKTLNEKI